MKAGWQRKILADVLQKTETVNPHHSPDDEFDYIDVSSVSNSTFQIEATQRIKGIDAPSRARKLVRENDVLFATIRPTLQRIAIVPERFNEQVCSTGYFVMRPNPEIDYRFLFYFLFSQDFSEQMKLLQRGASYPAVTDSDVKRQPISFPSLSEQRRIVALLDEAFDGIATAKANAEKNLQNARALFESVLDSVQGEDAPLGGNVIIKTGKLDANAATENGAYPFFTCAKEIYAIDDYAFDCEAILLAGNNAVGDFNVKHYKGKFNAYQRTYVITVVDESLLSYRFLYFQMLKSLRHFKKQSVGAGTKFLKLGMIKDLKISLPPIAKQIETASLLDFLLEETQHLESLYQQKITALDELKQSLLHQAFSGKL